MSAICYWFCMLSIEFWNFLASMSECRSIIIVNKFALILSEYVV